MKPFHFRQFSIQQSNAAMKVGTDAMLLGSLCNFSSARSVLDIGTGTGVLSLMVAQRFHPETITAIEIDTQAYEDAFINLGNHPFRSNIEVIHADIRIFQSDKVFDGIITNPPFFENSSKSENTGRNNARHTDGLSFNELFMFTSQLLAPNGSLWMIFPNSSEEQLIEMALVNGLYPHTRIHIEGKPGNIVRTVAAFGKNLKPVETSSLTVRKQDGTYTEAYIRLTEAFHGVDLSRKQDGTLE